MSSSPTVHHTPLGLQLTMATWQATGEEEVYYYICVHIRIYMCPHTTMYVHILLTNHLTILGRVSAWLSSSVALCTHPCVTALHWRIILVPDWDIILLLRLLKDNYPKNQTYGYTKYQQEETTHKYGLPEINLDAKGGSGKTMTGHHLWNTTGDGDTEKVL
jgi:hypothetical protein